MGTSRKTMSFGLGFLKEEPEWPARAGPPEMARPPGQAFKNLYAVSQDAFQRTKARYLASWLEQNPTGGRKLTAWGAGKVARRQADHLFGCGLRIECFFEVDPKKIGNPRPGLKVESIEAIPPPGEVFILVLAGARSARSKITRFLDDRDYISGQDYLFLA